MVGAYRRKAFTLGRDDSHEENSVRGESGISLTVIVLGSILCECRNIVRFLALVSPNVSRSFNRLSVTWSMNGNMEHEWNPNDVMSTSSVNSTP